MNTERHKGRVIRINGQTPANALKEAGLELKLAHAKVEEARASLSLTAGPEAKLALHRAEQNLARIKELTAEGAASDSPIAIKMPSIEEAFQATDRLRKLRGEKVADVDDIDVGDLVRAVRKAAAEVGQRRTERVAAQGSYDAADKVYVAACAKLTEVRTALLKHLGGGEVLP